MKIQVHQIFISLLIGIVVGYGGAQWQSKHEDRWKDGDRKKWMMERLSKDLNLSNDQRTQVQAIFEAKHPRMVAMHEEMRPKFEAIRNETHQELQKVLNPNQQKKFDELTAKHEERRRKRMEGYKL